jgi:hypothetical protein
MVLPVNTMNFYHNGAGWNGGGERKGGKRFKRRASPPFHALSKR